MYPPIPQLSEGRRTFLVTSARGLRTIRAHLGQHYRSAANPQMCAKLAAYFSPSYLFKGGSGFVGNPQIPGIF
jgi:hypothetical protein